MNLPSAKSEHKVVGIDVCSKFSFTIHIHSFSLLQVFQVSFRKELKRVVEIFFVFHHCPIYTISNPTSRKARQTDSYHMLPSIIDPDGIIHSPNFSSFVVACGAPEVKCVGNVTPSKWLHYLTERSTWMESKVQKALDCAISEHHHGDIPVSFFNYAIDVRKVRSIVQSWQALSSSKIVNLKLHFSGHLRMQYHIQDE